MKDTKLNFTLNVICRWFVGLVFIFSGFVKGVDPMGTTFKIQEYMTVWSIGSITFEWAIPLAGVLSMALVVLEFLVGVMLITGSFRRITAWVLAIMMVFFTVTTLIDAITNKVTDCGCFGDAVKLTNWETFWKNVVLDIPTIWIFLTRNVRRKLRTERDSIIAIITIGAMTVFGLYNIANEPVIDFRPWKVGNQMIPYGENLEVKSYLIYKNKETGETIEFESQKLMDYYQDTNWVNAWEFVDSRVVDPYEIQADGFSMMGIDGEDYSRDLVGSAEPIIIATIHHINDVDARGAEAICNTYRFAEDNGIKFVILSSALDEQIEDFIFKNDLNMVSYFFTDDTAIETVLRSNPGFILLKDAVVLGKWHYRNADDIQDIDIQSLFEN